MTVLSLDQVGDPPVDLAREDEIRAAADAVLGEHGRCDVLVHAAAAFGRADMAATVAFLASDAAAALTGQTLCTDGGLVMR